MKRIFANAMIIAAALAAPAADAFKPYDCKSFIPGVKSRATGAFRTERDAEGRWWLIDPLGRGFMSFGVQSANWTGCHDTVHDRYAYREANIRQFGTPEKWAQDTIRKYTDWGFNTLSFGCGSNLDGRGVPRVRVARFGQRLCEKGMDEEYWINEATRPACAAFPNVFHPRFAETCASVARKVCAPYRDDPWTIGYYLDNELAWWRGPKGSTRATGLFNACMAKKPGHSARVAAENWARAHGADPAGAVPNEVKRGFLLEIARRYFKVTSEAVRAADPNHLVMGCRFAGVTGAGDDEVWRIAGEYCDVVSFNCYPTTDIDRNTVRPSAGDKRSCREAFDALYALTKKPMMITEWAFPALDSGLPCLHGAGQRFYTQAERTRASELWMRTLLSMPYIVGWAVFRWVDQPAGGAGGNGEDSNYGLVNEAGVPYPCVEAFSRIQHDAAALRKAPPPEVRDVPSGPEREIEEMLARMPVQQGARVGCVRDGKTFRVTNGRLVAECRLGNEPMLARVALDGREIGVWRFLFHHDRGGERRWTSPDSVTAAEWKPMADGGGRLVVSAEGRDGEAAYRVKEAFTFTPGRAVIRVDLLEVANVGKVPIDLRRVYFAPVAPFAGEVDATFAQHVPNLWRAPQESAWFAKDGRFWGVVTDADRIGAKNFHVEGNGQVHADLAIVATSGALPLAPGAVYAPASEEKMRVWALPGLGGKTEWKRIVAKSSVSAPKLLEYDVVVAGGGPSGIGAAYMAASRGAKTLLVEKSGRLGGMAVQAMVSPFSDRGGSPHVKAIAAKIGWGRTVDFAYSDVLIYDMLKKAGCDVLLHTAVLGPMMDGERVLGVRVFGVDGERTVRAKVTVDCTGDGIVAAAAKVPYEMGRKEDGLVQPMSIMFTVTGFDPAKRFLCNSEEQARKLKVGDRTWEEIDQAEVAAGRLPPEVGVIRAYRTPDPGTTIINATQVNGLFGTSSEDLTKAEITCRRQAAQIVDVMRRHLPGYENVRIAQMPAVVGVRETRRFEGVERLELEDCLTGRSRANAIARRCSFPIDIHNPTGGGQAEGHDKTFSGEARRVKPYDIPYGAIVPKKVEGLLFAGRCLSASHEALASCRVMGTAMATGVGAGAAAAWAARHGCSLRDVPVSELHLFD